MSEFRLAHAENEDWAEAVRACLDRLGGSFPPGTVGFVYATDLFADAFPRILDRLRAATGIVDWIGGVGLGICAGAEEYFDRPALAVMIVPLAPDAYRLLPTVRAAGEVLPDDLERWIARTSPPIGIVHGDPRNERVPAAVEDIARRVGCFLVGGLTSSRAADHQAAGALTGGGVSGILLAPEVPMITGLSQGCAPLGPLHMVTDSVNNVVIALDERPALDVFREDIGELLARDLNRVAGYIHVAFPVAGSDTGDYTVRNLIGIDGERGWLAVGDMVQTGGRLLFVRRDPQGAAADLGAMLTRLRRRAGGRAPRAGLYVSCVARGPHMFGAAGREMAAICEAFGAMPVIGFYANGEISNNRLYGYTGVLSLFL